MSIAIELQEVRKTFKHIKAVDGVSFSIQAGEYVALLGPNGAGKTTLVEMMEGIQKPDSGSIQILGTNWQKGESLLRQNLGFSLQETRFVEKLTVLETMKLFTSFFKLSFDRCLPILERTGLGQKLDSFVENLSGGQRQKLALAIALVNEPKILILDEPTTGLDPSARREIWDILLALKQKSTTLILTTHYMEEAEKLCDRIIFCNQGKVVAMGTLDELLKQNELGEKIEISFGEVFPNLDLSQFPGFRKVVWKEEKKVGSIYVDELVRFVPPFFQFLETQNSTLRKFESKKMTLDDLFLSMTGRSLEDES